MKRKLEDMDVDDDSLLTSSEQRQSVLDISMLKLRSGPVKKVEPSLRRSVLIFNTLKSIEAELREEGGRLPLPPLMPVRQRHHVVNNNNNAAVVVAPAAGAGVGQCCGDQNRVNCPHCQQQQAAHNDVTQQSRQPAHGVYTGDAYQQQSQSQYDNPALAEHGCHAVSGAYQQSNLTLPAPHHQHHHLQHHASHDDGGHGMVHSTVAGQHYHNTAAGIAVSAMDTVTTPSCHNPSQCLTAAVASCHVTDTPPPASTPVSYLHSATGGGSADSSCSVSMSITETLFSDTSRMLFSDTSRMLFSDTSRMLDTLLNGDRLMMFDDVDEPMPGAVRPYHHQLQHHSFGDGSATGTGSQWSPQHCQGHNTQTAFDWCANCTSSGVTSSGGAAVSSVLLSDTGQEQVPQLEQQCSTSTYHQLKPATSLTSLSSVSASSGSTACNTIASNLLSYAAPLLTPSTSATLVSSYTETLVSESDSITPAAVVTNCTNTSTGTSTASTCSVSATSTSYGDHTCSIAQLTPASPACTSHNHSATATSSSSPMAASTAPHLTTLTTVASSAASASSLWTCRQEYDSSYSGTNAASYNADSIECNMFDFDMFLPPAMLGQSASSSPSSSSCKLTSLAADELTQGSHEMTFSPVASNNNGCWSPKAEHHLTDDLDHIMQILVGL